MEILFFKNEINNYLNYLENYINFFENIFLCIIVVLFLIIISFIFQIKEQTLNLEKNKTYECGFDSFQDLREKIDLHYHKMAIIFILFDIEIIFLYPYSLMTSYFSIINIESLGFILIFILFIILGYFFEYKEGLFNFLKN